jgi:hypothetical protein
MMKKKINFYSLSLIMVLALLFGVSAYAQLNREKAAELANQFIISRVDFDKQMVVISDGVYWFKLNTKVINSKGKSTNRYALKPGQRIDFKASYNNGRNELDLIVVR